MLVSFDEILYVILMAHIFVFSKKPLFKLRSQAFNSFLRYNSHNITSTQISIPGAGDSAQL